MKADPDLSKMHCKPCKAEEKALTLSEAKKCLAAVPGWTVARAGKRIRREWAVKDFLTALDFFNRVGRIAQAEDHHPDLHLREYRKIVIELTTHSVGGLSQNDFIIAVLRMGASRCRPDSTCSGNPASTGATGGQRN